MTAHAAVPQHPQGASSPPASRPVPLAVLWFALLSLAILALLPFLQLGDGSNIPRFALFLGRFHPVVLHVPIGMILLAILLEHAHIRGLRRWIPKVAPGTATFLMVFAGLSATVSTVLGWMLSFSGGYDPTLLQRHFYAGLSTAIGANLALVVKLFSDAHPRSRGARIAYQVILLATGACLGLAGHWGASITHGEDYLTEYAPDSVRHLLGLPVRIDPANLPWKPLPDRIAFADVVGPLLNDRCVSCHSGQKAKGGLRLDRYDLVLKGGNTGPAVIPGDVDKSLLLKYIDLPEDDEKHMPPKGKTQLSDDEQAILAWWVGAGAPEEKTIGELSVPAAVQLAMEHAVPEAIRRKQEAAERAQAAAVAAALGPLKKNLHGSLRLIVPSEPNLEFSANPDNREVVDSDLRQLETVGPNLILLDVARSGITDAGLASLAKMPNLTRLEIPETDTGDTGLQWIGKLSALEVLNLYGTHVSDKGLALLASSPKLRRVYLGSTQVTEAGMDALRKRIPGIEIIGAAAVPKPTPSANPAIVPPKMAAPAAPRPVAQPAGKVAVKVAPPPVKAQPIQPTPAAAAPVAAKPVSPALAPPPPQKAPRVSAQALLISQPAHPAPAKVSAVAPSPQLAPKAAASALAEAAAPSPASVPGPAKPFVSATPPQPAASSAPK
jgi:hypothetical protein